MKKRRGCCTCDSPYFYTNRRKNQAVSTSKTKACATNFRWICDARALLNYLSIRLILKMSATLSAKTMCNSPFACMLFFTAKHKQLAENVIQSHDDELYRKLRDPVIPVQNIYQQCHAGHFDKESGNPRIEKF